MTSKQARLILLGMAVLFAAIGCDNNAGEKMMKNAPLRVVYDDGGCAYDCTWSTWDCTGPGGTVVEGTCGMGQVCCQMDSEPAKPQCEGECIWEWESKSQGCPTGLAASDGGCSHVQKVCCDPIEPDTTVSTDDPATPEVCPYQCTYDLWNCENGSVSGLGADGFAVPDMPCSEEMVMQGKTLCCNTVDENPVVDTDACPYACTWDVWNCENGELDGVNGVALPELTCSNENLRQGRTMCCNTTEVVDTEADTQVDTAEDTTAADTATVGEDTTADTTADTDDSTLCPYPCTYDVWNCEYGALGSLGQSGVPMPDLTCPNDMVIQGKTLCCNVDAVDTEIGPDECPYDCTWDAWNCENGELGGVNGVALPELSCSAAMVSQGRTMCCNTESVVDTDEDTEVVDTAEDTAGEDTAEPELCPYECTYDEWNCENGSVAGLSADGFPVPELTCPDEMTAQGKTLCCNTVDENPVVDPDACPYECTWDVWNCENGEIDGIDGVALPNLNCSNAMVRQGRTMCCDTTGTTVDTDTPPGINECPYACTWNIWSCEVGFELGTPGMALPDLNCAPEYIAQFKTTCCRTDIVINE